MSDYHHFPRLFAKAVCKVQASPVYQRVHQRVHQRVLCLRGISLELSGVRARSTGGQPDRVDFATHTNHLFPELNLPY